MTAERLHACFLVVGAQGDILVPHCTINARHRRRWRIIITLLLPFGNAMAEIDLTRSVLIGALSYERIGNGRGCASSGGRYFGAAKSATSSARFINAYLAGGAGGAKSRESSS